MDKKFVKMNNKFFNFTLSKSWEYELKKINSNRDFSFQQTNEINDLKEKKPWKISFSYGRALQENALKTWLGKNENKENAQKIFLHRAKMNSLASAGKWNESFEKYT